MVVEGRRTAAAESISLPVAFEIKESFPTSASIQEACWSLGVVYELWCLVHAQQQHGQIDGGIMSRGRVVVVRFFSRG